MSEVRVIDPIAVGDSWGGFPDAPMLDTNVSETTGPYAVPLYDAATTYGLGLRCTVVSLGEVAVAMSSLCGRAALVWITRSGYMRRGGLARLLDRRARRAPEQEAT